MGQYNGKRPFSLVYVLKPLRTAIRAIGDIQALQRSWTKDYLEQIQQVVTPELELGISRFQVRHPDRSATLKVRLHDREKMARIRQKLERFQ